MDDNLFNMKASEYSISPLPEDPVIAMAYIPFQNPVVFYSAQQGIEHGTLFPGLNKPFMGCEVIDNEQ